MVLGALMWYGPPAYVLSSLFMKSTRTVPLAALGIALTAVSYVAGWLGAPMRLFSTGAVILSSVLVGAFFWSVTGSGSSSPSTSWGETVASLYFGGMILFWMLYSCLVPVFGAWALGTMRRLRRAI
jgi:hypothetical protein